MAKTKISEFDSTPANNTDIDGINIAEGCAPSGINNAIRELMSQLKNQQTGADSDNFSVGGNLAVAGTSAFTGTSTFTGAVTFASTVVLSTALPVASGGTGSSTAANARTSLGAAASGANSDITSLTGLTTALTVAQGGTGAATHTSKGVLIGNGTSAVTTVSPSTSGNVLTSDGTNWTSAALSSSGLAKAWVSFDSSGTILKAYNVSSVTQRGTGQWTINFTTALADANYVMSGNATYGPTYVNSGGVFVSFNWDGTNGTAPAAGSCQINTVRGTYNGSDATYFNPARTTVVFFD
jgi:hypothetical protein